MLPAIAAFAPDLVMISAAFDAHEADPLASLRLVTADFAWATNELAQIADQCCAGRLVSTLEVGYDMQAVAAGLGIAEIQVAGGWKSPTMVARYSEALDIGRGAVAKLATLQNR